MQKIIGIFILFLFTPFLWGADIGSDTVVTRFNTQQEINDGDRVAGFAALAGGFVFASTGISGTWDTFFEVTGNIDFTASTLNLNRDLIFRNVSNWVGLGNIVGNCHTVELSSTMTCIPNRAAGGIDCRVVQFLTSVQAAAVNTVDWSFDDVFFAVGLDTSGSNELLNYEFDGSTLILRDSINTSPEDVLTVRWHPSKLLLAVGTTSAVGDELFIYSVSSTGTFTLVDSDDVGGDAAAVTWHPEGTFLAVGVAGAILTPEIFVYPVDANGNLGTRTSVNEAGNRSVSEEAIDWITTGSFVAVGFQTAGGFDQLRVYEFSETTSALTLNASNPVDNATVTGVGWNPVDPHLLGVTLLGSVTRLRVFSHNGDAGTLTQVASQSENQNQALALDWDTLGHCLAIGKGVSGVTTEFKIYPFDVTTDTFGTPVEFDRASNVNTVRWSRDGDFIAIGTENNNVVIYQTIESFSSDECFLWSNVKVVLDGNVSLKESCITFGGYSILDGLGHCLSLDATATLEIAADASLLMQNITIKGVNAHKIFFLDQTSTVSFKDVVWVLDGDYEIENGHFDILSKFKVVGQNHAFAYKTTEVSRILDCGIFVLDDGVTFSYAPPIADSTLLQLTAVTSKLVLNSATLDSTTAGLQLDTGILEIEGLSKIMSAGTMASQAIAFGDGSSSANNLTIHLLPAANLELTGFILDNNV